MQFSLSKSTVIHPILFAVFPILLIITSNLDEVILIDAVFSFLIIIGITLVSWLFLNLFLKNKLRSGLFVSLGLVLFFSYGHFLRITSQIDVSSLPFLPFSHHTYAIPVFFVMLILGIFAIIKIKKHLRDVTTFTNIIAIVLIIMLLPNVVSHSFETLSVEPINNPLNYKITHELELKDKPNIYYIIVDEYTSDEILLKIYDYDNQDFLSKLVQRGFYVPSESYTNYPFTTHAISASLNMQYVNENIKPTLNNKNEFFNNNQIMRILKSMDYTIINLSHTYGYPEIADYHLCPPSLFVNEFHSTLLDGSIWQPFSKFFFGAGDPQRDRVNCKFSELSDLQNSFDSPFFVFSHIVSPHPPYLFGPNGESVNSEFLAIGAASWDNKSGYVNQVQYINKKIIETIDKILLESESQPVIIIQGDHGTPTQLGGGALRWNNINDDSITERMSILNVYYFPHLDSEVIYDGITPVNSFRLVLNNYLNGNYELLEDRMYFGTYQDMLNLTDVTSLLSVP